MSKDTTQSSNFQQDTEINLNPFSGELHAFDTKLCKTYGMQEAILIHHMLFWIKYNVRLKRNYIEGRTWTYQTLDEIAAHFPYLNKSQVFDVLEKLCLGKSRKKKNAPQDFEPVLMKGNFNKNKYDHTLWYAFVDEEKFGIPKSILEKSKIDDGKSQHHDWEIPTPIPDTIPDPKKHSLPKSKISEEAKELSVCFLKNIIEEKPDFKAPRNMYNWNDCFDKMLRLDGRDVDKVRAVIEWVTHDSFWKANILSPAKLRDKFDQLELKMNAPTNPGNDPQKNKEMSQKFAKQNAHRSKEFYVGDSYIEFIYGGQCASDLIYYSDPKFIEKIKFAKMKWGN